ncbi:MAG: hypothetical protein AB7U61_16690 [Methylocystis sp.]
MITVVFHVSMFVVIEKAVVHNKSRGQHTGTRSRFIISVALIALGAATLHGLEATAWAVLFIGLGALPDASAAILYSLGALTTFGHASIFLENRWKLLGAIEAMNGAILFGLTTAFLFAAIGALRSNHAERP